MEVAASVVQDKAVITEVGNQTVQVGEAHRTSHTMAIPVTMATMGGEVHRSILKATLHHHHPTLLQTLAMHLPLYPGKSLE